MENKLDFFIQLYKNNTIIMTSYLDNKNMTTIEEEVEGREDEEVKDRLQVEVEVETGRVLKFYSLSDLHLYNSLVAADGKVLGYRKRVEDCVKPSVTLPVVIPPCSISFTFRIFPERMRFFGKINCYRRHYGEEEAMDLYVEKLVIKWLNYMRNANPLLADSSNICVGILGTSTIYSPSESLFPCDTSYKEKDIFDFYYDAWMGEAYFNGERIKKVWTDMVGNTQVGR